ncbi:hypothetical protein [Burkholderia gladioli]|uniref:hypothetical protein n=1 Tax=Burkholderia gladioli TaxID=28095 RepID=UPI0016403645|nr:hypothetical protein [Burkholderia gladioli]
MEKEHFKGVGNAGKIYDVFAFRTVIHDGMPPIYSLPDYRLADGRSLTPVRDRVFQIVQTGEEITLI